MMIKLFVVWLTDDAFSFASNGTIVIDPYHREFPTRREQDLNLCRIWVQALLNEIAQQ